MKVKPLLPSLREKKRYIAFEIISKHKINAKQAFTAIWNSLLEFAGQKETAKAGMIILKDKYNQKTQKGIIRISHKMTDTLKSALILIKEIGKTPVVVKSITTSGILKKAEKNIKGA